MTPEEKAQKREKEKRTVELMISIYCRGKHKRGRNGLCSECAELRDYAFSRTDHCPYIETKKFCSGCKTHCYKGDMREKIREVMRYSGPRMIIYCPGELIRHKIFEHKHKTNA